MTQRFFTVAEADALIGPMESVMAEIARQRKRVQKHHEKLQVLDVLWGDAVKDAGNPDHVEFQRRQIEAARAVKRIEDLIQSQILARGIRFPYGGLEHGLLDFPTTLDGRVVYLCWKRGEPHVAYWHEVDGGFSGRRPVTPEIAQRMGG